MKRIKPLISLFLLTVVSVYTYACGNEYYRSVMPIEKNKLIVKYLIEWDDNATPYWMHGFGEGEMPDGFYGLREKMEKAGIQMGDDYRLSWPEMQTALAVEKNYKLLSDYAWYELRVGDKKNAVKLLEALYAKHPDEYNILANLGTAYEVTGKNEKALTFLRKAVAINPESHFGSEWIHIKILEQKVAATPDYKLILDLKADNDPAAWLAGKVYDKPITPDSLMVQLAYQLHERIGFVPAPDPIVGQLVKDFGDLVALTRSKKEATDFYAYAVKYDSTIMTKLPPTTAKKVEKEQASKKRGYSRYNTIGLIVIGVVLTGGIVFYNRKKKKNTT